jgi:hypothetical protein
MLKANGAWQIAFVNPHRFCNRNQSLRNTDPFSKLAAKNISKKKYPYEDLATAIRFARDPKSKGGASGEE